VPGVCSVAGHSEHGQAKNGFHEKGLLGSAEEQPDVFSPADHFPEGVLQTRTRETRAFGRIV